MKSHFFGKCERLKITFLERKSHFSGKTEVASADWLLLLLFLVVSLHGQLLLVTELVFPMVRQLLLQRPGKRGCLSRNSNGGSINPQGLRKLFWPSLLILVHHLLEYGAEAFIVRLH